MKEAKGGEVFNYNKSPERGGRQRGILTPPLPMQIDLETIRMIVWYLTTGFGRDADLVAAGGAEVVVMIERDPVVAVLLGDGL